MTICPVWQCGGEIKTKDSVFKDDVKKYFGDKIEWQIPSFVCDDCGTEWYPIWHPRIITKTKEDKE